MIGATIAVILLTVAAVNLYKYAYKRPANFPPGPPSLPVYGAYWLLLAKVYDNLAAACIKYSEEYKTKLLGFSIGKIGVVIVNDTKLLKEVLNREDFDGRMDIILGRLRSFWKKLGIFFTDGYFWHVQRRFTLRYMRDYGFGRRDERLESTVEHEVKEMLDMAANGPKYPAEKEFAQDGLIYLPHFFAAPFINGLVHVFSNTTVPRSEYHELWKVAKGALLFQRSSNDLGAALSYTPWIKDIIPEFSGYKGLRQGNQKILDFLKKIIQEAVETHDETNDRHFLDVYIKKMKAEIKAQERTTYSVDQLLLVCTDYMFPTASAVESVLTMLIERLLLNPDVQEKIHEEIDRVVGRDRIPTLNDRSNMPYTEACIREGMRIDSLVPLGVPHRTMKDTKLDGFDIPANTMINVNYLSLHMDKETWGDPENFRPERFIVDGTLKVSRDYSLPFGSGRRLCAGETFARQSMFQVFAAFMQAFKVSTADGKPLKEPAPRIQGIITTIPNFWIRVTPRS